MNERATVVLNEYDVRDADLSIEQVVTLRRLSSDRVSIQPTGVTNLWRLKASSFVGTITTPDLRVLIKPKVPVANLFYLLEAQGAPTRLSAELFGYEETFDLIASFATFFVSRLDAALGQGIPRSYVELEERSAAVRGRVNLAEQRRLAGLVLPVACRFDEFSADIRLNRILKAAAVRLLRLPGVPIPTRARLRRHVQRLEEVGDLRPTDLATPVAFTRLTSRCRSAERLARLVLRNSSIIDAVGAVGAASFLLDMNQVFEDFVSARLRDNLAQRLSVGLQVRDRLDEAGHASIRPDLVFAAAGGRRVYIADCKYKVTADGFGVNSDYYQLTAYAVASDLPEGLLIYCRDAGVAPPRQIQVRHGGPGLRTVAIGLDHSPQDIDAQLAQLADEVAARAGTIRGPGPGAAGA